MNQSLEPLPTKQLVAVKARSPKATVVIDDSEAQSDRNIYPWLLAASTCLSVVLCWMYVTKPVIAAASNPVSKDVDTELSIVGEKLLSDEASLEDELVINETADNTIIPEPSLIPSAEVLPGEKPTSEQNYIQEANDNATALVDPLQLSGWEKTHHKVQHVLQADLGNDQVEKIVIDVPVFYQTRMMRWEPEDVETARSVLSRLLAYEADLNKLKVEGEAMLLEWNQLLEKTVPMSALRADSPSLPYNHSPQASSEPLSDSEPVIQIGE